MAFSLTPLVFLLNPRARISKTSHHRLLQQHLLKPIKNMSWSCKKCTFLNSPSQHNACKICLSPPSPSPSPSSAPKWPCKACTFLNLYKNSDCEICGTRAPVSSLSSFEDLKDISLDVEADSSVGSVFLPLKPCGKRKMMETNVGNEDCVELGSFRSIKASNKAMAIKNYTVSGAAEASLKILSYNVWFREELEVQKRMKAIGDLIQLHSPDLICFQEVTPNIYDIFRRSNWWKVYRCSVSDEMADSRAYFCMQLTKLPVKSFSCKPFENSIMGRELCMTEVEVLGNKTLIVATSHLESPCPAPPKWDQMYSKERVEQAKQAINILQNNSNVIFGGDMNWDDKVDGQFPLPDGWIDAWRELRPADDGWTYDTKSNQMLSGNRTLRKRLDRFVCNLHDFKVSEIEVIGTEAIPGLSYAKEKNVRKEKVVLDLPVLPSDHYGLLLTISSQ
ncbi:hypothetical protein DITRI_Ditri19aG0014100 [Diplodiscus trichospermus]